MCFCCLLFIAPLENFSLTWRRYLIDPHSASTGIEWFGFLMWHRAQDIRFLVYLRGSVTFKRLSTIQQWNYHYLFNDLGLTQTKFEHPTFCMLGKRFTISPKQQFPPYQNVQSLHFKDAWDSHKKIYSNYIIFENIITSQVAVICLVNVCILSAVLLAQRYFPHRPKVIPTVG